MNIETLREYCISKKGTTEEFPFGPEIMVFKVMGKIFAIMPLDNIPMSIALKCDPEKAIELREEHEEITPGWHLNKKHWNSVNCEGRLPDKLVYEMIEHSYEIVAAGLGKALKAELELM